MTPVGGLTQILKCHLRYVVPGQTGEASAAAHSRARIGVPNARLCKGTQKHISHFSATLCPDLTCGKDPEKCVVLLCDVLWSLTELSVNAS